MTPSASWPRSATATPGGRWRGWRSRSSRRSPRPRTPTTTSSRRLAGGERDPGPVHVTRATVEQSVQRKAIVYDRLGDAHYDAASALIKSMRGGDPDAAIYWLAVMLEAGEDVRFVARRVAIFASEDVGAADPSAVQIAAACYELVTRVGLPECRLTLAQAVLHMANAPKSRSVTDALARAAADVREARTVPGAPPPAGRALQRGGPAGQRPGAEA